MGIWQQIRSGSIRSKILMGFMAVMLFADTAGMIAIWNLGRVKEATSQVAGESLPRIQRAQEASAAIHRMRIAQLRTILADEDDDRKAGEAAVKASIDEVRQLVADIRAASQLPEQATKAQDFATHWEAYLKGNDKAMALTGEFGLKAMGGAYQALFDTLKADVHGMIQAESQAADASAAAADATYRNTKFLLIGVLLVANVFGFITAAVVSARIATPLAAAAANAKAVAKGDLTQHLTASGTDEVSVLAEALNDMQHGLRDLVQRVRDGVESMHSASVEIASGGVDLSNRTERQVCALEDTSNAIAQLTNTVQRNAETSRKANVAADEAASAARQGGEVTNQIVEAMSRITSSSERISAIVSVIDGIAFQTNLLALNAAVEAARAGEQGRGFAVVASEVRGLAQRVAQSAREIKTLIEDSSAVINHGAALVQDAGHTMKNVVSRSDEVTQLVASITASTQQQANDISNLNQSIASISDSTQQNAALAEQSASAVTSLKDQGANLDAAVAVFKLS